MATVESLNLPDDLYYEPKEHLWVKIEDGRVRVGIDELGCSAAGTISYVDLQKPGKRLLRVGGPFGTLEANKFVGALRTPIRGTIVAINQRVLDDPRTINADAYRDGWFVEIEPSHLDEDLAGLVHGEAAILRYVETKLAEYRSRGVLPEAASVH